MRAWLKALGTALVWIGGLAFGLWAGLSVVFAAL